METGLELFHSSEFGDLRVLEKNGEAWFIAKEVCDFLGTRTDNLKLILEEDEIISINPYTIGVIGARGRDMLMISEAGFYSLILKARKVKDNPERTERIRRFRRWVTHDVLPALRKKGSYSLPQPAQREMSPTKLAALRDFITIDCKVTGVQVTYALDRAWRNMYGESPLALSEVSVASTPDDDRAMYVTVSEIGKLYGMSARALNPVLTDLGLQTCEETTNKKGKTQRTYMPTELGAQNGGKRFSDSARNDLQREVWNLFWHKDKLPAFLDKHLKRKPQEQEAA